MIRDLRPVCMLTAAALLVGCGFSETPSPGPGANVRPPSEPRRLPADPQPGETELKPPPKDTAPPTLDPAQPTSTAPEKPEKPEKPAATAETGSHTASGGSVVADPRARPEDRAAMVGGRVINRRDLLERLLYSEGPKVLDLMVEVEIARQLAAERGVKTDDGDREKFVTDVVRRQLKEKGVGAVPDEQFQGILEKMKRLKGESVTELAMERLYYLDRTARRTVNLTDDEVKREFDKVYGEKLRLRCIMVGNYSEAAQILDQLKRGEDFGKLAEKVSRHATAQHGGQCDPVSVSLIPPTARSELAGLKPTEITRPISITESDGQIHFYLFQLLGRDPAQNVRFEQVADELRQTVEREKVQNGMKVVLAEIQRRKLAVTYFDERLRLNEK